MDQDLLHVVVTVANAAFTAFRIAAHVPQLIAVARDTGGAQAISVGSWIMFALANASNAVYAIVMAGDWLMCGINLASATSCMLIAGMAFIKQRRHAPSTGPSTRDADRRRQATSLAMPNAAAAAAPPIASV